MKGFGVVHVDHVGEFVDDDVVDALLGYLYELGVEGDDTAAAAVAPLASHASELHLFGAETHKHREVLQTLFQIDLGLFFVEVVIVSLLLLFGERLYTLLEHCKARMITQRIDLAKVEDLFTFDKTGLGLYFLQGVGDPALFLVYEFKEASLRDLGRAYLDHPVITDTKVDVLHPGSDGVLYRKALVTVSTFQASP